MGIMDRDWYKECWERRVLQWTPPRRRIAPAGIPLWPFVALAACIGAAWGFALLVRVLRAL